MQTIDSAREQEKNFVGGKPNFQVTKRPLWDWEIIFGLGGVIAWMMSFPLILFSDSPFWIFLNKSGMLIFDLAFVVLALLVLFTKWRPLRTCRYRVDFGLGTLNCNDPTLLNALAPSDFLLAQPADPLGRFSKEHAVFKISLAGGELAFGGTFENMAAWAMWRFGAGSIKDTLRQIGFPWHLSSKNRDLPVCFFFFFLFGVMVFSTPAMFLPKYIAGIPLTFFGITVTISLCALIYAGVHTLTEAKHSITMTDTNLEIHGLFRSKIIPLGSIRKISPGLGGFMLIYDKNGGKGHERIGQVLFAEVILLHCVTMDPVSAA